MASTSEAALKLEIARLTGAINRAKSGVSTPAIEHQGTGFKSGAGYPNARRSNTYVNPNYKPASQVGPKPTVTRPLTSAVSSTTGTAETREVVIGGVAFESSGRSLVRKDLPKPTSATTLNSNRPRPTYSKAEFLRSKAGHLIPNSRVYKPKSSSRGRRGRPTNRNMTLNNAQRPFQTRRLSSKKYSDKPCPRFTTTGACSRGLTCLYQHDPSKIAICWSFLQGNCPNTADSCNLSHDPTPERTPLCMHFANNGRCNRDNCPFPHVRVGARQGICRDFAVLGYCDKGLECDKQHVRECPDFAEKGNCSTKGCKLPHVIRANRNRKPTTAGTELKPSTSEPSTTAASQAESIVSSGADNNSSLHTVSAEDAKLGDEYISLTFHESESSEDEDEDEESGDDDEDDDGEEQIDHESLRSE